MYNRKEIEQIKIWWHNNTLCRTNLKCHMHMLRITILLANLKKIGRKTILKCKTASRKKEL